MQASSNGYPSKETSGQLYDEMDYQRAGQAYTFATPLVNSGGAASAIQARAIAKEAFLGATHPVAP